MTSWQTDTKRDMLTYRFIELSASLIESVLVDNEADMKKYTDWLSMLNGNNPNGLKINDKKPSLLSEINPTKDSSIKIIALPSDSNFIIEYKTPIFSIQVSMIYDFDRYDISVASILNFEGEMVMAISYSEEIMSKIDEMRIKLN